MADRVTITERPDLGLATLMARNGIDPARIGAQLGVAPPTGPQIAAGDGITLVGTGPNAWLAVVERPDGDGIDGLARQVAGLASVSDQSGGYVVFRIAGPAARALLQRGAFVDLDPAQFGPGSAATTVIAHIGVILWQLPGDPPAFDVALFRSFAHSFRHWFAQTAAAL